MPTGTKQTPEEKRAKHAAYMVRWRAKNGARTGKPGRQPTEPCGTVGAYKRHLRERKLARDRGEEPPEIDQECRDAWAKEWREKYGPNAVS